MRHVGDITKLRGADLEPVDCVVGGSPCQDLSIAGKRAGLAGERSGLYMEQIRITKELREEDVRNGRPNHLARPRFLVWENVPGAFSSNGGKDFAAVLEEAIKVAEPEAPPVPVPEKGWPKSGCLYDEMGRWSVAWKLHDAQFWGVPQRRKRIALVADFGGLSAPEILFERKGLSWHPEESGAEGQGTAPGTERSPLGAISSPGRLTDYTALAVGNGQLNQISMAEQANTLDTMHDQQIAMTKGCFQNTGQGWWNAGPIAQTIRTACGGDSTKANLVAEPEQQNFVRRLTPLECERLQGYPDGWTLIGEPCEVEIKDYQIVLVPGKDCAYQTESDAFWAWEESVARDSDGEPIETFDVKKFGFIEKKVQVGSHKETRHFYRDENGRKRECSDTARYKALGNSIALPFWFYLLRRISAQYERPATLGSLFDGIGGFPLCWEKCNGPGTALWASEIEEFPMAVTKVRFR